MIERSYLSIIASLTICICLALLVTPNFLPLVEAASGDPDPTFDGDGKVTTDFFGWFDGASAVAIQSDGKIVAAGSASAGTGDFALVRYESNGAPDATFGIGGKVGTDFSGGIALDIAIQNDGKIIVVGRANGINATADFGIARYDTNGNPDPTFGVGGKVTTDFSGDFDAASGVAIQSDGKIVVVGRANGIGATANFGIARYDTNGNPDPTFGMGGKVTTDFFGDEDSAGGVAIQQGDGKIVVVGTVHLGGTSDLGIVRYDTNGNPDATFGVGGKVTTDFAGDKDAGAAVVIQPGDGKIVVAGRANSIPGDFALARYDTNGNPDPTFGVGGKVTTDFSGNGETANDLALQTDGKIVAAGTTQSANSLDFGVARYDTHGNLDPAFGVGGKVITDFFGNDDGASGVTIQTDSKIVVAGFANKGLETDFALARYGDAQPVCPSITLAPNVLPNGTASSAYNQTITASPAGAYSFSLAQGNLPSGLTLNGATGVLSGLTSVPDVYNFIIKAQTNNGCSGTRVYTLTIVCPAITLSALTTPTLNTAYNQTVTAAPGGGNYSFAMTSGALPNGLSLNSATGVMSGTPTTAGTFNFTLTATGFGNCSGSRSYAFTIGGSCPAITLPNLPNGQSGQLYNQWVAASPSGSYSYAVTIGSLPPGLQFFSAFGLLYGYPTTAGTYPFTITATDANKCTGSRTYTVQTAQP